MVLEYGQDVDVFGYEASFKNALEVESRVVGHWPAGGGFEVRGGDEEHVGDWHVVFILLLGTLVRAAMKAALTWCEALGLKTLLSRRLGDDGTVSYAASGVMAVLKGCVGPYVFE